MALASGTALLHAQLPPPAAPPGQTFRTGTDVVLVDVSVRDGNRLVTGLRAEDFVLTDNGVRQQIESVEATAVPIDLTLVVDLSGNANGSWVSPTPEPRVRQTIQAEVDGVVAMLRPADRVRVLGIDRHVQQLVPMSPVEAVPRVGRVEFDGLPSMFDTLAAALLYPSEPARRPVVVARTKGLDTIRPRSRPWNRSTSRRACLRPRRVRGRSSSGPGQTERTPAFAWRTT